MGFFSSLFKSAFEAWLESVSDEELSEGYEKRRQQGLRTDSMVVLEKRHLR